MACIHRSVGLLPFRRLVPELQHPAAGRGVRAPVRGRQRSSVCAQHLQHLRSRRPQSESTHGVRRSVTLHQETTKTSGSLQGEKAQSWLATSTLFQQFSGLNAAQVCLSQSKVGYRAKKYNDAVVLSFPSRPLIFASIDHRIYFSSLHY